MARACKWAGRILQTEKLGLEFWVYGLGGESIARAWKLHRRGFLPSRELQGHSCEFHNIQIQDPMGIIQNPEQ